jgi:hypothetical protein
MTNEKLVLKLARSPVRSSHRRTTRGPRRQGHNAVAHGGRSHREWALSVGHGVKS